MRRKKSLFRKIMRRLPRRLFHLLRSITRKRFNAGMVVNGASVVIFERDNEPEEYRIGGYYSVPCMHNDELMRCEKIFFLNDMINIVFDAFTALGYQSFAMETTDAEHMFRIMDKEAFLKQPENTIFKTGDYDYYNVYYPFYIKGGSTGKSGDFYFSKIHTELHITGFAAPGRRIPLPPASALPVLLKRQANILRLIKAHFSWCSTRRSSSALSCGRGHSRHTRNASAMISCRFLAHDYLEKKKNGDYYVFFIIRKFSLKKRRRLCQCRSIQIIPVLLRKAKLNLRFTK